MLVILRPPLILTKMAPSLRILSLRILSLRMTPPRAGSPQMTIFDLVGAKM